MLQKLSKCEVKGILSFYRHFNIPWNQMLFLAILEVLNFDFSKFEQPWSLKFTKNSKFRVSKIAENDIFGPFELYLGSRGGGMTKG